MITFQVNEPVNIPNCIIMVGGEFEDTDLVSICKWDDKENEYTKVQAHFLKYWSWK